MDFLAAIARERREGIRREQGRVPTAELRERAEARGRDARSMRDALRRAAGAPIRAIAEVKRSSPTAGVLRESYDPAGVAAGYEVAGAAAISVLTEPSRFGGSVEHVRLVRERVSVPIIVKDFVVHERQLFEARAAGADAVLLIVALLSPAQLRDYASLAGEIGLEPLLEIHEAREVDRALEIPGAAIGVNNRDLRTLEIRRGWAERMIPGLPPERVRVAESGYGRREEIEGLERLGADAVLVGESLLRTASPGEALRALLGAGSPRERPAERPGGNPGE